MIQLEAKSIPEFMRALVPTEPHFPADTWYFRGQADASWGLTPTARREKSWEAFGGVDALDLSCSKGLVVSSDDELRHAERSILDTLKLAIKRQGLPPTLEVDPARVAFAQHVGLPTRLLDWSRSPWTAAYSAASDALRRSSEKGELAVYCMADHYLKNSQKMLNTE